MKRVLLVEDLPQVAQHLQQMLSREKEAELVGVEKESESAIARVNTEKPDVVMIDALLQGNTTGFEIAKRVRAAAPGTQIIIVTVPQRPVDPKPDQGIDAVFVLPGGANELASALAVGKREIRLKGRMIVCYSPKGGSGKTTIAVNLATILRRRGNSVALMDGVMQFGSIRHVLQVPPATRSIVDLPTGQGMRTSLSEVLWEGPSGVAVLLGPPRPEEAELMAAPDVAMAMQLLAEDHDYVIVDAPSKLGEETLAMLDVADRRRLEGDRRPRERARPAAAPLERAPVNGAADRPIGVFDSGVGGLTVLRELRRQLPNESTIYLGDEARMPYGPREPAEVVGFTREAMRWFAQADCKLVVIACNTATSVALETVRDEFGVPTIGVIRPGAAAALTATARRAVGVLATVLTVRSGAYVRALRDLDPLVDVAQQACPKLVPLVEDGKAESPEALAAVREYVEPLLTEGGVVRPVVDTLLLGCTHYPLLRAAIEKVAGRDVRVVDSATTTALAVREVLASHRLTRDGGRAEHALFCTGSVERFRTIARAIFHEDPPDVRQTRLAT